MTLNTWELKRCTNGGAEEFAMNMALLSATAVWAVVPTLASHTRDSYLYALQMLYGWVFVLHYVATGIFDSAVPNPECNSASEGFPVLIVFSTFVFIAVAVLHDQRWSAARWTRYLFLGAIGLTLLVTLPLSGNNTAVQAVFSALLGVAVGSVFMVFLWVFVDPYLSVVPTMPGASWIGISHTRVAAPNWVL